MRSAFAKTSLLGAVALVLGALTAPASAQDQTLHAELGTLRSVELAGGQHVVRTTVRGLSGTEIERTYRTTETTSVEGLGGIGDVAEITHRSHGNVVIVTFARDGQQLVAENIRFTGDDEIHVTRGTVLDVEGQETLVLATDGEVERLDLDYGYGATVEGRSGLMEPSELRAGQEVTVYYADLLEPADTRTGLTGHARLIVQTTS